MTEYKIISIEEKVSKKGKGFWTVHTDNGNYTCWNSAMINEIKEYLGGMCQLMIEDKNGYKTIVGLANDIPIKTPQAQKTLEAADVPVETTVSVSDADKKTTMYTSYAKDIFIALLEQTKDDDTITANEIMNVSILLVKQAKEAFS